MVQGRESSVLQLHPACFCSLMQYRCVGMQWLRLCSAVCVAVCGISGYLAIPAAHPLMFLVHYSLKQAVAMQ